MKQLATTATAQNIQLVSDFPEYSTDLCNIQDDFLFVQEPVYDDVSLENNSDTQSNDDTFSVCGSFSDSEGEEESNDDIENVPLPSEHGHGLYFPFPSELFLLLYSYVHNVSRPKVFFTFICTTKTFSVMSFIFSYIQPKLASFSLTEIHRLYILHAHSLVKFSLIESRTQEQ
jgi:hypothetical protein